HRLAPRWPTQSRVGRWGIKPMLRRTVLGALVSLVAAGSGALPAFAGAAGKSAEPSTAEPAEAPIAGLGLPRVLGGLARTDVARGPSLITTVYAGPGALAQIMVTTEARSAADGADERMAPTLRQLHDALIDVTRRQGGTVTMVGQNRTYRVGGDGTSWTWLG